MKGVFSALVKGYVGKGGGPASFFLPGPLSYSPPSYLFPRDDLEAPRDQLRPGPGEGGAWFQAGPQQAEPVSSQPRPPRLPASPALPEPGPVRGGNGWWRTRVPTGGWVIK